MEALESVDSRRFLPHALLATALVIAAPALVVVALSPLTGVADLLLSALLATGLSVAAGSVCSTLWTRLPQSRDIPFGDLMLWAWARRVLAERRLAKASGAPLGEAGELASLRRLSVVFEARDGFSHGHSGRVARHAERIARRLGLPADEIERIEAAAAVHDVGMVGVPRTVLARDGQLTADERALVERHAVIGADKVAAVADAETAALVRHHHEHLDGSGYPDGLAGSDIPLGARIIAVADSFDDLVSPAPQRSPRRRRNALDELTARAGSELDAAVVAAFVGYYSGARSIAGVAFAATAPQRAVRWIAAAPASIGAPAGAPVALQSICAAGTAALAGACLSGLPALSPDRDGERPTAERRLAHAPAGGANRGVATELVATEPASSGGGSREHSRRGPGADGDGAPVPRSGAPQDVPTSGGGEPAPTSPQTGAGGGGGDDGGGGTQPNSGDGSGGDGGGGSSSASPPDAPAPSQPTVPVDPPQQGEPPPPPPPPAPASPASQLVDPVLDGLSEAVPQTKPITDAVKGIVGGLTGGLLSGGR